MFVFYRILWKYENYSFIKNYFFLLNLLMRFFYKYRAQQHFWSLFEWLVSIIYNNFLSAKSDVEWRVFWKGIDTCSFSMGNNLQMLTGIDDTCTSLLSTWFSGIRPVTKWSLVQAPLWSLDVVCCALIDKVLYLHCLSPATSYWYMLGVNLARTSVPSRGSQWLSSS